MIWVWCLSLVMLGLLKMLLKKVFRHMEHWVFDEFIRLGIITPEIATDGLDRMLQYGGRLPEYECRKMLRRWRSMEDKNPIL